MADGTAVDYVVVGAGAAGCVLARRLIERLTDCRVLLLEAGGPDENPAIHRTDVPSMISLWGSQDDWGYQTEEESGIGGRRIPISQGKVLGGSSSINAMMYIRGNRRDYDHWNHLGNEGWDYESVLPYFKKSEDYEGGESEYRGAGGPLHVRRYGNPSAVSEAFVEAAMEMGFAGSDWDCNAGQQENGAFFYQSTRTADDRRCSTAEGFLKPLTGEPRLRVETGALVTRVIFEGLRAIGVEYVKGGVSQHVHADREVVVSAGTFASPKLLMLSGIGAPDQLRSVGIDPLVALPGVGQNLQDHLLLGVGYRCTQELSPPALLAEAGLFTYSRDGLRASSPDLQYFFGPVLFVAPEYHVEGPAFTFAPILAQPQSRGSVSVRSADPAELAVVRTRYLQCQADVDVLVRGIELARELVSRGPFDGFRGEEVAPGPSQLSKADLDAYVRKTSSTVWHPVGTCRMGHDADAVVDPSLRVHGIDGLRVVDASVMPRITSGNTNAPTIMIAEKAVEMIVAGQG